MGAILDGILGGILPGFYQDSIRILSGFYQDSIRILVELIPYGVDPSTDGEGGEH